VNERPIQSYTHGDHVLRLQMPEDMEAILARMTPEDFGPDERMPYWAKLWPGSFALADYQAEQGSLAGKSVLELGCGLALNGMLAARLGGSVTVTDWFREAMALAEVNAALNGVALDTVWMDWNHPPTDRRYDLILGADLLYERRNHAPILAALPLLLAPGGVALFSDPGRPHLPAFRADLAAGQWHFREFKRRDVFIFELSLGGPLSS
jgi:predicted nicotinamide N-methyase